MASNNFDLAAASDYIKTNYGPAGLLVYNGSYSFTGMLQKDTQLSGGNFEVPIELSIGVGVGSAGEGGSLPEASNEKTDKVSFGSKNTYARMRMSRKLMKAATGGETAFIKAQAHKFERTQRGFAWNMERNIVAGKSDGILGTIDSVVDTDPTFVVVITAATFNKYVWEVGILVNNVVGAAAGTNLFEVTAINPTTRAITLVRQAGAEVPAAGNYLCMQGSYGTDLIGLKEVADATIGVTSLYGVTAQYRWMPYQKAAGAAFTETLLDEMFLEMEATTGDTPDYIYTSLKQWKVLKAANQNLKRYQVANPNVGKDLSIRLGFTAIEYLSGSKTVPIFANRFIEDDRCYAVNKNHAKIKHIELPSWFEEDGSVLMRTPDSKDDYEARYGAYCESWFCPTYLGVITTLS